MNNEEIRELITKFYEGGTSEDEEKLLRAIFSSNSFPESFAEERDYILYCIENGKLVEASNDFEERILKAVDKSEKLILPISSYRRLFTMLSGAAAVLLIIFGAYFFFESRNTIKDTFNDPEVAYAETMRILLDVSTKLNKGTQALKPVRKLTTMTALSMEKINRSSELFNKSLGKLNNLDKGTSLFTAIDTINAK